MDDTVTRIERRIRCHCKKLEQRFTKKRICLKVAKWLFGLAGLNFKRTLIRDRLLSASAYMSRLALTKSQLERCNG